MSSVARMCYYGDHVKVREAIGRGEDVNNSFGSNTGLMWAVSKKHNSIVRLFLEQPTLDLNCTDNNGWTALHQATIHNNFEGVQMLLADPRLNTHNHKDKYGKRPVMTAMALKHVKALRELVAHPSVDLDTRDVQGRSLEDLARWVQQQFIETFCFLLQGFGIW